VILAAATVGTLTGSTPTSARSGHRTPTNAESPPIGATCDGVPATITGTNASELVTGTPGNDVILAGNDTINAQGGNDRICGDTGNDNVIAGDGNDRLLGDDGNDVLLGGHDDDAIDGGAGADTASFARAPAGVGADVLTEDAFNETDPDLAARLAATPPPPTRTFTGRRGYVRRSSGPGWALVGDAGYFKDPLSAHGLTDALRDAELLARAITALVIDGADEADALAGYQTARDALAGTLFDVTDVICGHTWTDIEIGELLLLLLNATMADEVTALAELPPLTPAASVWSPLRFTGEGLVHEKATAE
jgi:hypothetical protein